MYLEKAIFINRAPFERIELDFIDKGVNVLSAINGKGKTTILSHIVDAFYEVAKSSFSGSFEGCENKYYRVSSTTYSLNQQKCSIVYLRFKNGEEYYDYIDVRDNCSEKEYDQFITIENKIPYKAFKSAVENNNNIKQSSKNLTKTKSTDIFNKNILTYFPSYRYEQPGYLNDPYKIKLQFVKESGYAGKLNNPIEVITGFSDLSNWLMDVILDNQLYGRTNAEYRILNDNIRRIVSQTLISKLKEPIRLGVGPRHRGGERISIMSNEPDVNKHRQIYPSIFNLSTGELAIISIFGEILRQSDKLRKQLDVEGIVLIDEVDKHLHIKLQKEILPQLMSLFPNMQFIVSSHSPFFSMGLAEQLPDNSQIIDLDNNGIICTPQSNELYKEVYDMMIGENDRFAEKYKELEEYIGQEERPLIITEGFTDIKHLKKAKEKLGFDDMDIDFYEVPKDFGDSQLKTLLDNISKIKQHRIVIGIFDRDSPDYLKYVDAERSQYKSFGDSNVYAFAIPMISQEVYGAQISIEHCYKLSNLQKEDSNGRRLFIGSEFYESGNSKDGNVQTKISNIKHKVNVNGVIDDKVFYRDDLEQRSSIALSKGAFADLVESNDEFTDDFDFSGFAPIFAIIRTIVSQPLVR